MVPASASREKLVTLFLPRNTLSASSVIENVIMLVDTMTLSLLLDQSIFEKNLYFL